MNYMKQALTLAEKGRGLVSPNPMVGALVVKNNEIIATGYHGESGVDHAEVIALHRAGESAKNAELYITLEPCTHVGKTPPCVDAIIRSGVTRVYIACDDPNPLVNGRGKILLQNAGIEIIDGIEKEAAEKLNEVFFHYMMKQKPFVIAKWAMSLDGKTKTRDEDHRQMTDAEAQCHTHALRRSVDAILIGAETACADNPQLTVRDAQGKCAFKQPLRIVIANRPLSSSLNLFSGKLPGKTRVFSHVEAAVVFPEGVPDAVEWTRIEETNPALFLEILLSTLAREHVTSVLVEGGMHTLNHFFESNLVNRCVTYISPCLIGAFPHKRYLTLEKVMQLGRDVCMISNVEKINV